MKIVYILKSLKDNTIYSGNTDDIEERLDRHKKGYVKSTKHKLPIELVCYTVFKDKEKAYDFERYLKTGSGRAFIKKHFI